jgi:hypothetical protein
MEDTHTCLEEENISNKWNLDEKWSSTVESPGFGTGVSSLRRQRLSRSLQQSRSFYPRSESPAGTIAQTKETNV